MTPHVGSNGQVESKSGLVSSTHADAEATAADAEATAADVNITYTVNDIPPFSLTLLLAFQHYISMFVATLSIPFLLAPVTCMGEDNVGKSQVTGTLFVVSGVITLLQTFLGCRLPIVQGGTFCILVPTLSYFNLPQWKCPANILPPGQSAPNNSNITWIETGSEEHREIWMSRYREIQGAIMCAALFEVVFGATGIVGVMMRFIGPLSIFPTVTLLGLSLFKSAADFGAKQWWICLLTIVLMVIFSQYLGRFNQPCLLYSRSKGFFKQSFPLFKMFPVIIAVVISWLLCWILTVTNVFPPDSYKWGYFARTDLRISAIYSSPWFRIPYPFQWGWPTVSLSAVLAVLAGVIATTVESVGDYHACAKLSGVPPPPLHAVNRGILVEGIGSFLDGIMGTGNGTTSTSINVGVIGITKVGSRRVVQWSAAFMVIFGLFTKFGALFVTIPDPIIGGSFFILFGMIVAVGISSLQYVNMNSGRNLFIIGFSLFVGLALPQWVLANPRAISTGVQILDNVFTVLLSIGMFVGGVCGFVLDNTIPGTREERGFSHRHQETTMSRNNEMSKKHSEQLSATYDLPVCMGWIRRTRFCRFLPFSPSFGQRDRIETTRLDSATQLAETPVDSYNSSNV